MYKVVATDLTAVPEFFLDQSFPLTWGKSNVVLLKSKFFGDKEFCFLRLANDEWQFLLRPI